MDIKNNYNLKKDSKFLKITTGVVAVTLAVGLSNEYFKSITSNHNTYSFAAAPAASSSSGVIASGNCGEAGHEADVTWQLTQNEGSDTYTLTISGQGKMADFEETSNRITTPWWQYKDKIIKLVVNPGVTHIGMAAFCTCEALQNIELSEVETIGMWAFDQCTALETANMPNVKTIDELAFAKCSSLKIVNMPKVKKINERTFYKCILLNNIELPEVETIVDSFEKCSQLETVIMPKVKKIYGNSFNKCSSLREVTMPEVELIDRNAFAECNQLQTVEMPFVKDIGYNAFKNCAALVRVIMPPKETVNIAEKAFEGCSPNLKFEVVSFQAPQQASADNTQNDSVSSSSTDNQNVDLDGDDEDNGNILLDKELTDTETVKTPQEVATETTETVEPSPTTATTTNTNIPNTGAQNNGLLAVMLTTLGGAWSLISKKRSENN